MKKVSTDPELETPVFDQYQRYHFIERAVETLFQSPGQQLLEVGGAYSPLRRRITNHRLWILDASAESREIDIRGSGLTLPFPDESFPAVISTDTLEHVTSENRGRFLFELQRVSSNFLILGFPDGRFPAGEIDRAFFDVIKSITGDNFKTLKEHIEFGLPNGIEVREELQAHMKEVFEFQNAGIRSWILMQISNFFLDRHPELRQVRRTLNELFENYFEAGSHEAPFYRSFLICSKTNLSSSLRERISHLQTAANASVTMDYASASLALVTAFRKEMDAYRAEMKSELQLKEKELEKLQLQTDALEDSLYRQEIFVEQQRRELAGQVMKNHHLQQYLDLFLNHPLYKVYRFCKKQLFQMGISVGSTPLPKEDYQSFLKNFETDVLFVKDQRAESVQWKSRPLLNLVTAVFNVPAEIFTETIFSVQGQSYDHWIWNIVDASTGEEVWRLLKRYARKDSRIRPLRVDHNGGISANLNIALQRVEGDFVAFLDHDDTIAPFALYEVAQVIRQNSDVDFIYSDADKIDEFGRRCEPLFKPDWSPEMMLSFNLLNQFSVFRRSWLDEVGVLNADLDGAQDWDLYLRIVERTDRIFHIPKILYHWRKSSTSTSQSYSNKPGVRKAQKAVLETHLLRTGLKEPRVEFDDSHRIYSMYPVSSWKFSPRKVSVIIPSRDQMEMIGSCLRTLFLRTDYKNYEVTVVDTGSKDPKTWELYESFSRSHGLKLARFNNSFNFSGACNLGAMETQGEILLFLNNDTQIISSTWLERMLQWFERPNVGVVGAKLLFPNGRIQHAGVILGMGGLASHLFYDSEEDTVSIFGSDSWFRNLSSVTGACLMVSREAFDKVGGFDENFLLNYGDVDLCLRVREAGYRIVYTPEARLIHHEGVSHGRLIPRSDFEKAFEKFDSVLRKGDPYFNPNLSCLSTVPSFRQNEYDNSKMLGEATLERLPRKEFIKLPDDLME